MLRVKDKFLLFSVNPAEGRRAKGSGTSECRVRLALVDDIISLRLVIEAPPWRCSGGLAARGRSIQLLQPRNWKFKDASRHNARRGVYLRTYGGSVSGTTPAVVFHATTIMVNAMTNANHVVPTDAQALDRNKHSTVQCRTPPTTKLYSY